MKKSNKLLSSNYHKLKLKLNAMITIFLIVLSVFKVNAATTLNSSKESEILRNNSESDITITGTVRDELGQPMVGVTIVQKGSAKGTISDSNGSFSIVVPSGTETLILSYVGYENKEVATGGKTNLVISMVPTSKSLNEVVVVGYGSQKKRTY